MYMNLGFGDKLILKTRQNNINNNRRSHKNIKEGGIFNTGLFARDFVELTAAIPDAKATPEAFDSVNNIVALLKEMGVA